LPSPPIQTSPLNLSTPGIEPAHDEAGRSFWREEGYYESECSQWFSRTLDEEFEAPIIIEMGSYWVCESATKDSEDSDAQRLDVRPSYDRVYVVLCTLHPVDRRLLRVGFWARDPTNEFSRVENEMLVIALATTGLTL